jgi:hypothetical protein
LLVSRASWMVATLRTCSSCKMSLQPTRCWWRKDDGGWQRHCWSATVSPSRSEESNRQQPERFRLVLFCLFVLSLFFLCSRAKTTKSVARVWTRAVHCCRRGCLRAGLLRTRTLERGRHRPLHRQKTREKLLNEWWRWRRNSRFDEEKDNKIMFLNVFVCTGN